MYGRSRAIVPLILNLATKWMWIANLITYSGNNSGTNCTEAGWTSEPVLEFRRREKSLAPIGIRILDRPARSLVAQRRYSGSVRNMYEKISKRISPLSVLQSEKELNMKKEGRHHTRLGSNRLKSLFSALSVRIAESFTDRLLPYFNLLYVN